MSRCSEETDIIEVAEVQEEPVELGKKTKREKKKKTARPPPEKLRQMPQRVAATKQASETGNKSSVANAFAMLMPKSCDQAAVPEGLEEEKAGKSNAFSMLMKKTAAPGGDAKDEAVQNVSSVRKRGRPRKSLSTSEHSPVVTPKAKERVDSRFVSETQVTGTPQTSEGSLLTDEVYRVSCKDTVAEWYTKMYCSGGKGRCVKFMDKWMTPNEFERIAGMFYSIWHKRMG